MVYLHNDREVFAEAINLVQYKNGISAEVVEKDYYVTMILRFLADRLPFIVFKGGTSLSKCHRVIKRFSEDIDITIDTSLSQGQRKKVKEAITEVVNELGLTITNLDATRSRRDYNRYVIAYESVLQHVGNVIQPAVLVETSYTTTSFPVELLPVESCIGELLKEEAPELLRKYCLMTFEMKVQKLERTFVDKVFAVCDYYLQNRVKKHSRHLYDIYKLYPLISQGDQITKLIEEVRNLRKGTTICPSAQDGVDVPKLLEIIISNEVYKEDYNNLTINLLDENVSYEDVIETLKVIARNGMFVKNAD